MEKVLSIIVPTYNMEKYLNNCLNSLIVPNIDLLEVLVINDGSKDRSSEIAHEYEKKYPDVFRVIDKENGNYGSCINKGIIEATGKYVKILDADDSFDTRNFEEFLERIKNIDVDLILTDFTSIDEDGKILLISNYDLPNNIISDYLALFKSGHINFQINMHAVTYRRQNLVDMNYSQTEGISYTDMEWCFTPMTKVKSGVYYKINLYKYLLGRPGQTMDISVRIKQLNHLMKMTLSLAQRYKESYTKDYHNYLWFISSSQISNIYKLSLIDGYASNNAIVDYDNELRITNKELYDAMDSLSFCKIKFVNLWRKSHSERFISILKKLYLIRNKL